MKRKLRKREKLERKLEKVQLKIETLNECKNIAKIVGSRRKIDYYCWKYYKMCRKRRKLELKLEDLD